jgi:hypothetical protein
MMQSLSPEYNARKNGYPGDHSAVVLGMQDLPELDALARGIFFMVL